jgi:hypothetical protein
VFDDENGLLYFLRGKKILPFFANIDVAKYCDWLLSGV